MSDLCRLIWGALIGLRHQLNVLRRKSPKRMAFGNIDRVMLVGLYHLAPKVLEALKIITPENGDPLASRTMREHFTTGSVPFRKAYMQSLIDVIEVDDRQIRIK